MTPQRTQHRVISFVLKVFGTDSAGNNRVQVPRKGHPQHHCSITASTCFFMGTKANIQPHCSHFPPVPECCIGSQCSAELSLSNTSLSRAHLLRFSLGERNCMQASAYIPAGSTGCHVASPSFNSPISEQPQAVYSNLVSKISLSMAKKHGKQTCCQGCNIYLVAEFPYGAGVKQKEVGVRSETRRGHISPAEHNPTTHQQWEKLHLQLLPSTPLIGYSIKIRLQRSFPKPSVSLMALMAQARLQAELLSWLQTRPLCCQIRIRNTDGKDGFLPFQLCRHVAQIWAE